MGIFDNFWKDKKAKEAPIEEKTVSQVGETGSKTIDKQDIVAAHNEEPQDVSRETSEKTQDVKPEESSSLPVLSLYLMLSK